MAKVTDACTNPNCKAKKHSTHSTANCYWPGGGKEGQFPPNFGQRTKANVAHATYSNLTEHFVLSARIIHQDDDPISGVIIGEKDEITTDVNIPLRAFVSNAFMNGEVESFSLEKTPTFMDSGASDTMFVSREDFAEYKATPLRTGDSAKATNGNFDIVGEGRVIQWYLVEGTEKTITFTCALHTPTLNANLISISALDKAGLITTFGGGQGIVRKQDGTVVLAGRAVKGMYIVNPLGEMKSNIPSNPIAMSSVSKPTSLEQWHRRLTHCSPLTIQEMVNKDLVDGLNITGKELRGKCEDCILGPHTRRPFDSESAKALQPLELVSFDLWGPSRVQSVGEKLYFMPIIDAGTSYKDAAYLSDKADSSTIPAFDTFCAKAELLTGNKIRRLHTDRAFKTTAWEEYCKLHNIIHEFSAPYSSAQNGLAERAIRTTIDDVRTLLRDSGLSHSFWAEAAAFSIEVHNLIPSRRHPGVVPLEAFTGKRQDISHLQVFGSKCWAKIPTVNGAASKIEVSADKGHVKGIQTRQHVV